MKKRMISDFCNPSLHPVIPSNFSLFSVSLWLVLIEILNPTPGGRIMADRSSPADAKLNDVIVAYLEAAEAGWAPPAEQVLTAYPDLRAELAEFFRNRDSVERIAAPLRDVARAAAEFPADEPLGRLGDFQLLREVGRGGMGVVYEAEQISLRRRVALKVLPFAAAIDARHLQRFRTEAMAAANLQHENIVPVYAVGTERGVHYYAMRFIDGQSLAEVVASRRGAAAGPDDATGPYLANAEVPTVPDATAPAPASGSTGRELPARKYHRWVADIGRQAALALEHAHQSGIVHRDIKPANLLLDSAGKPWVADFGLAQVSTADAGLTLTGEILGTLRYASPEQALAKPGLIDHRSDVYSLGATLYELLTLQLMFAGVTRLALLRQIAESEPIPLRQLDRSIPAELETIVLKAVAKEPADRYPTAAAFADDLQRFLDDRPILARRPTVREKAVKWLRRHPTYTAVGVLVLVLAAVGFGIATALISREKNRTESAMLREKERANEAERRFDLARNAADDMIRFADEELGSGWQQGARRRLLETALAYYQQFIDLRKDDPNAAAALEATRVRVSGVLADLAVMQGANRHLLLRRPDVQDELRLTDAQREQVRELSDRIPGTRGGPRPGFVRMTGDQWSRKIVAEIRAHEAEVTAILSPDQLKRLGQVALQLRGPTALQDSEVIAALKLTAAQREQMRALEAEGFGRRPGPPPEFGGPSGRGFGGGKGKGGPPFEGFNSGQMQKWLDVLTAEQKATWQAMTGPPFHGKKR